MIRPDLDVPQRDVVEHLVAELAHLLPTQGPIGVFVHHNTLHAFEHLDFEQAVVDASRVYGAEPYMSEDAFRAAYRRGRIRASDLDAVLSREPEGLVLPGVARRRLMSALLYPGVPAVSPSTVSWHLEEGWLAEAFAADPDARPRFAACLARIALQDPSPVDVPARLRDVTGDVHPLLTRLCAAFLDQGLAYWPMPGRDRGFHVAVSDLLATGGVLLPTALRGLERACRWQRVRESDAADVVVECLLRLGLAEDEWEEVLQEELLALRGWAGLFATLEREPHLAPHVRVPCRLMDYLAVRLTLKVQAGARRRSQARVELNQSPRDVRSARAAMLSMAAGLVGITLSDLLALDEAAWDRFTAGVDSCDHLERRRLWQAAFEHHHEDEVLGALQSHRLHAPPAELPVVSGQIFFCIDEREESMRRAVEEVDPSVETFGAAGFFGIAVRYHELDAAHSVPLCPVIVTPQHAVVERPQPQHLARSAARTARRRLMGRVAQTAFVSSRTLLRGWVSTALLGGLASVPLIGRILTPRAFGRLRTALNDAFLPVPRTELLFMREDDESQARIEGLLQGFSVSEKADRVEGVLSQAGLTRGLARLVVFLGHGSTSLNNPLESAYDCGACGGRRGGTNARLFAAMANHAGVRYLLRARGIDIAEATWFVGGYHDTCSDDIQWFDVDAVPASHTSDLERIRRTLDLARGRNAHERVRRFASCAPGVSVAGALVHVEERAEHLAQPRPECGHGTNAVCIVGRRAATRGLFLDRRSFLVSYDAGSDPRNEHLARLLGAAIPVCAGISLEYYFSFVDNDVYGCGTKLPHNVTALVGVMDGQGSDLRTGLPRQMVETHEPVRILFVIETTPRRLQAVLDADAGLDRLVRGRWLRIATLDPDSGDVHVWRNATWERREAAVQPLPVVSSSPEWYQGHRECCPPAWIQGSQSASTRRESRA